MKKPQKENDIDRTKAIMGKLASMPHKPHVKKNGKEETRGGQ
jgi:hypothetical protein